MDELRDLVSQQVPEAAFVLDLAQPPDPALGANSDGGAGSEIICAICDATSGTPGRLIDINPAATMLSIAWIIELTARAAADGKLNREASADFISGVVCELANQAVLYEGLNLAAVDAGPDLVFAIKLAMRSLPELATSTDVDLSDANLGLGEALQGLAIDQDAAEVAMLELYIGNPSTLADMLLQAHGSSAAHLAHRLVEGIGEQADASPALGRKALESLITIIRGMVGTTPFQNESVNPFAQFVASCHWSLLNLVASSPNAHESLRRINSASWIAAVEAGRTVTEGGMPSLAHPDGQLGLAGVGGVSQGEITF